MILHSAAWLESDAAEDIWKFWTNNNWEQTYQIYSKDVVESTMHMAQKKSRHIF